MITDSRLCKLQEYIDNLLQTTDLKHPNSYYIQKNMIQSIPKPIIPKSNINAQISAIQKYIESLEYNHLGDALFTIKKHYSVNRLSKLSMEMISCGLPIKCLEATVLGMYLTMGLEMDRIPMAFKSTCEGNVYRHIVLVIKHSKYGAIGLSRRTDLMDKPLTFKTLSDLVYEYKISYTRNNHVLEKIKIGLPVSHQIASNENVVWKSLSLSMDQPWPVLAKQIDTHARTMRK